ncbi:MAG TPA: hypothetical protein VGB85_30420 [Nannocystis sp.]|jgi:dienelactone hydrolase
MLIVLDDAVLPADAAALSSAGRDALENLAKGAYEGNHMVTGSRKLLLRLKRLKAVLGAPTCDRFTYLSFEVNDAARLRHEVRSLLIVHEVGYAPRIDRPAVALPGDPIVFRVGLDYFARTARIQPTQVIGEDQRDADFFSRLASAFALRHPGIVSATVPVAGGGVNTDRVLIAKAPHQIVLCVVDTDQDTPQAPPKDTARRAIDAGETLRLQAHVADVYVLRCRELENMLPKTLVLAALPDTGERQERDKVERAAQFLGRFDYTDLKAVASKHILKWVSIYLERVPDQDLAAHCFQQDIHPAMAELAATLWSFGLAPVRGST